MRNGLVIDEDGNQFWYKDNLLHRDDDLPAIIYTGGIKFWHQNGLWHRENGPADMWADGENCWWIEGVSYSFDEWCLKLNKSPKEKAYLLLKYFD